MSKLHFPVIDVRIKKKERLRGAITGEEVEVDLTQLLGSGNFSYVFLGTIVRTGIQIAVKIIRRQGLPQRYIDRETEFVKKQLCHPNVVQMLDYTEVNLVQDDKGPFVSRVFFMEYCPNGTFQKVLDEAAKSGRPLDLQTIQHFFLQMVKGVQYLHQRNIIHRDLKPENFLLAADRDTKELVLKVSDLGISREVALDEEESKSFHMTAGVGTGYYRAPEAYKAIYGLTSDIWALGVLLFEMVEGEHLLHNMQDVQRLTSFALDIESRFKRAHQFPHCVSLLRKLLDFESSKRPSLEELLTHEFFQGKYVQLVYTIFIANSCKTEERQVLVSPCNSSSVLIAELNRTVPPFATTKLAEATRTRNCINFSSSVNPNTSAFSAAVADARQRNLFGENVDYSPENRIYLFEDGSRVDAYQSIEGLLKFNKIYMFYEADPNESEIVEDGFVLLNDPTMTTQKKRQTAFNSAKQSFSENAQQIAALHLLLRYVKSQFSSIAPSIEEDISTRLQSHQATFTRLQQEKLKEIAEKLPHRLEEAYAKFTTFAVQAEGYSRERDVLKHTKYRLIDALTKAQKVATLAQHENETIKSTKLALLKAASESTRVDDITTDYFQIMLNEVSCTHQRRKVRKVISLLVQISSALVKLKTQLFDLSSNLRELDSSVASFSTLLSSYLMYEQPRRIVETTTHDALRASVEELQNKLKTALEEKSALIAQIDDKVGYNRALMSEVATLRGQIQALTKNESELKHQLQIANTKAFQAEETFTQKIKYLQDNHAVEIKKMKADIAALTEALEQRNPSTTTPGLTKSMELNNWAAELDFKKLMIQELQDTIDNLHVQVTELKIEVAKSKQQADEAIKANDAMQNDPQLTNFQPGRPVILVATKWKCYCIVYKVPKPAPSKYIWLLVDPDSEIKVDKPIIAGRLITTPDFSQPMEMKAQDPNFPHFPAGELYTTVIVEKLDLPVSPPL